MARVDPADDRVRRLVVFHYRYDSSRRERRNVDVAAFTTESEFRGEIARLEAELRERKRQGLAEDVERIGGVVKEAGYQESWRRRRARGHGGGGW